ncbi:MAG: hypothetical protein D6719_09385 [Candidatus Dadabacteria bacterium]|nr:MAG: hypothetical protein D6719_09385 [Candidatus Dadabacteria bacterium]
MAQLEPPKDRASSEPKAETVSAEFEDVINHILFNNIEERIDVRQTLKGISVDGKEPPIPANETRGQSFIRVLEDSLHAFNNYVKKHIGDLPAEQTLPSLERAISRLIAGSSPARISETVMPLLTDIPKEVFSSSTVQKAVEAVLIHHISSGRTAVNDSAQKNVVQQVADRLLPGFSETENYKLAVERGILTLISNGRYSAVHSFMYEYGLDSLPDFLRNRQGNNIEARQALRESVYGRIASGAYVDVQSVSALNSSILSGPVYEQTLLTRFKDMLEDRHLRPQVIRERGEFPDGIEIFEEAAAEVLRSYFKARRFEEANELARYNGLLTEGVITEVSTDAAKAIRAAQDQITKIPPQERIQFQHTLEKFLETYAETARLFRAGHIEH